MQVNTLSRNPSPLPNQLPATPNPLVHLIQEGQIEEGCKQYEIRFVILDRTVHQVRANGFLSYRHDN